MALLIKICGLKSNETLDAALDAGADLVGLVFFPPSPRHLTLAQGRALRARARGRADVVALTVDASDAEIAAIIEAVAPDWLQFHGSEPPERLDALRRAHGTPVMKAIGIESRADLARARAFAAAADRLVLDAKPPKDAAHPGGLGKAFDWTLLQQLDLGRPYMLSGGLDADNVAEALRITRAPGVDVSSGVERVPGDKDPDKIRDFIRAARAAAGPARTPVAARA